MRTCGGRLPGCWRGQVTWLVPALDRFRELSLDDNWGVRRAAAWALGRLGASAAPALDRLLKLTRDADPLMRRAAAEALGRLGDRRPRPWTGS